MAALYVVFVVGVLLLGLGVRPFPLGRGSTLFLPADVLQVLLVVAGTLPVYGALIAVLYTVLADANARGTA